jgi:hypothetical protein
MTLLWPPHLVCIRIERGYTSEEAKKGLYKVENSSLISGSLITELFGWLKVKILIRFVLRL